PRLWRLKHMLKIRLRRMGATNKAFYRLIVSDSRKATSSAALEEVGTYDPRQDPPRILIDRPRIDYWLGQGALLSDSVKQLVARSAS
ncbi:MAG: 30S ribosomal protein S16, partial [Thermoanaerobaculia bacterium]